MLCPLFCDKASKRYRGETFMLKFVIITSIFFTSILNLASTKKVLDGSVAYCKQFRDTVESRLGNNHIKILNSVVSKNKITYTVQLVFLKCVQLNNNVKLVPDLPFAQKKFQIKDPKSNTVYHSIATPLEVEIWARKDSALGKITKVKVIDKTVQVIKVELKLSEHLSAQELVQVENSHKIDFDMDFWVTKIINFKNQNTGFEEDDIVGFGYFRNVTQIIKPN